MPTPQETREIAREAYIYGFPIVTNYRTLYKQTIDNGETFNVVGRSTGVATPADQFVVTPNSDTPYSYLWLDLRAEPLVVTMPMIERKRYYSAQFIDLYTFNFAYLGSRTYGHLGGNYLVAGPGWTGEAPPGIDAVLRCETQIAYVLFRTQLFNPRDWKNVEDIQLRYRAQPLSWFEGKHSPSPAPPISWPPLAENMMHSAEFFSFLAFLLQFCPTHPTETTVRERFTKIGIEPGKPFEVSGLSPESRTALEDGIKDAWASLAEFQKLVDTGSVSSAALFGTREVLKNNFLYRFAAAKSGLYGNSAEEALYFGYFVDESLQPCDASKSKYTLAFPKGALPPAKAFWSLTMYDGKTQLLSANAIDRYLLNSTMLQTFKYGDDGSLTFYIQKDTPGPEFEPNWLPAPEGPFYVVLRLYLPDEGVISGAWSRPPLRPSTLS